MVASLELRMALEVILEAMEEWDKPFPVLAFQEQI